MLSTASPSSRWRTRQRNDLHDQPWSDIMIRSHPRQEESSPNPTPCLRQETCTIRTSLEPGNKSLLTSRVVAPRRMQAGFSNPRRLRARKRHGTSPTRSYRPSPAQRATILAATGGDVSIAGDASWPHLLKRTVDVRARCHRHTSRLTSPPRHLLSQEAVNRSREVVVGRGKAWVALSSATQGNRTRLRLECCTIWNTCLTSHSSHVSGLRVNENYLYVRSRIGL
mmetsp:Transcript_15920/g.37988  ORF Transcript_15920/g.37988 Transcript_15920/m.37988 type:complete len:225 (+) Transcript_15920:403-1077(+)